MFGFGSLMMILFWGCILYVFFRMVRHGSCYAGHHVSHATTPMDILKERYAKGEITKEEFISMKEDLK